MTFTNGQALIIAASTNRRTPALNRPTLAADARALAEVLRDTARCGYPPDRVALLANEQATRDGILGALDDLAARTGADDTVLIFFTGYADANAERFMLLTDDTDLPGDLVAAGGLDAIALLRSLRNIKAGRVLLVLHTSRPGGRTPDAGLPAQLVAAMLGTGAGRIVLAAGADAALEQRGDAPTAFGRALVDALGGAAPNTGGYVGVFGVYDALRRAGLVPQPTLTLLERQDLFAIGEHHGVTPGASSGAEPDDQSGIQRIPAERSQAALDALIDVRPPSMALPPPEEAPPPRLTGQAAIERIISRAASDTAFRQRLIESARAACQEYDLTEDELNALDGLDAESIIAFAGTLDKRISKTSGVGFFDPSELAESDIRPLPEIGAEEESHDMAEPPAPGPAVLGEEESAPPIAKSPLPMTLGDDAPASAWQDRRFEAAMPKIAQVERPTEIRAMIALADSEGLRKQLPAFTEHGDLIAKTDVDGRDVMLEFSSARPYITVYLELDAPGFQIDNPLVQLRVLRERDSGVVTFFLTPTQAGQRSRASLRLYQDPTTKETIDTLTLYVDVAPADPAAAGARQATTLWQLVSAGLRAPADQQPALAATGAPPIAVTIVQGDQFVMSGDFSHSNLNIKSQLDGVTQTTAASAPASAGDPGPPK